MQTRESPFKVLICKPSSLGDVVQALAVVRHIKKYQPESQIYWWISTAFAPLLQNDPDLAGIFLFDKKALKRIRNIPRNIAEVLRLRQMHFDWVLDLQSLLRSAVFAWLCGGKETIGLDDRREWAPLFYDYAIPRPFANAHAVDWYLDVVKFLKIPLASEIDWLPQQEKAVKAIEKKFNSELKKSGQKITVQPCTRWPSKQWPIERLISCLQQLLQKQNDIHFSILGSVADVEVGKRIMNALKNPRVINLCGKLSLPEMVEWIRRTDCMITNDTGPMHVAAALKKPIVALFGATNPLRTGPYGQVDSVVSAHFPCSPCLKTRCPLKPAPKCMYAISSEQVVQEVLQRIQ